MMDYATLNAVILGLEELTGSDTLTAMELAKCSIMAQALRGWRDTIPATLEQQEADAYEKGYQAGKKTR